MSSDSHIVRRFGLDHVGDLDADRFRRDAPRRPLPQGCSRRRKYRSSNTPQGVIMYLLAETRADGGFGACRRLQATMAQVQRLEMAGAMAQEAYTAAARSRPPP